MNMQEFKAKWHKYLFIEMQFHNVMCLKKTDTPKKMKLVRETQKY
jgi:hypothetical protein